MKSIKAFKLSAILVVISLTSVFAQIPVSVNRSTINGGGTVTLPQISGQQSLFAVTSYEFEGLQFDGAGGNISNVTGVGTGTPNNFSSTTTVQVNGTPIVRFAVGAPSAFTNTISVTGIWHKTQDTGAKNSTAPFSQSYAFTVIEDGSGSSPAGTTNVVLTGEAGLVISISRNSGDTSQRKLVGFQLSASRGLINLSSLAFTLSNTSTNGNSISNLNSLRLLRDADGGGEFDASDSVLASTTNSNGVAIFTGLNIPVTVTNTQYFLSGSFNPSLQSKNSFITATLKGQNVSADTGGVPVTVSGGPAAGIQYGFFDSTTAEEAAFAFGLTNGLGASSTTLINNSSAVKKSSLGDSVIPAAAAGAAGISAAFTSDSLNKNPTGSEFSAKQGPRSSEFSPKQ